MEILNRLAAVNGTKIPTHLVDRISLDVMIKFVFFFFSTNDLRADCVSRFEVRWVQCVTVVENLATHLDECSR